MFFIQSRKIHFLFIAGSYFKISAVTASTHSSPNRCNHQHLSLNEMYERAMGKLSLHSGDLKF